LDQNTHGIVYEIDPHIFHSISLDISYALAKVLAMTSDAFEITLTMQVAKPYNGFTIGQGGI
jgi:hypothetical protein